MTGEPFQRQRSTSRKCAMSGPRQHGFLQPRNNAQCRGILRSATRSTDIAEHCHVQLEGCGNAYMSTIGNVSGVTHSLRVMRRASSSLFLSPQFIYREINLKRGESLGSDLSIGHRWGAWETIMKISYVLTAFAVSAVVSTSAMAGAIIVGSAGEATQTRPAAIWAFGRRAAPMRTAP